ncbi:MAG: hypothetical protein AB1762_07140 [Gemmatimonadota bacterium]
MNTRLVPVILVALVLLAAVLSITPWPVGSIQDDATYVVLGKSLASGDGYRQLNLPDQPQVAHYPPAYPLLLAVLWKLWPEFPHNLVLFKYVNAVLLALGALGAYAYARKRLLLGSVPAAAGALTGTTCVLVLYVVGIVLSEPLFLALLFPTLIAGDKAADAGTPLSALTAGALGGLLTLVRTIGIVFLPALVLVLLMRRHWRAAGAALLGGLCFIAPWQIWAYVNGGDITPALSGKYGSYLGWMLDGYRQGGWDFAVNVVTKNVSGLGLLLNDAVMPVSLRWMRIPTFVLALAVLLFGLTRLQKRTPVVMLFLSGYLAIMLLWPFEVNRFLMVIFPLVTLPFTLGLVELWRVRPQTRVGSVSRMALLGGACVAIGGFLWYNARGYRQEWWSLVQRDSGLRIGGVVSWVRRNTAPNDIVAVQDDPAVYLYTGRPAVPVNDFYAMDHLRERDIREDLEKIREILHQYRPRFYIVGWRNTRLAADSLARVEPELIQAIDSIGNATVYSISLHDDTSPNASKPTNR